MILYKKLKTRFSKDIFSDFSTIFIFMFFTIVLSIANNHSIYFVNKEFHQKLLFSSILLMIISTSLHLFFFKRLLDLKYKTLSWALSALALYFSVYFYYQSALIFFLSVLLFLSFSPFLFKNSSNEDILSFNLFLISTIIFAALSSLILLGGIEAILLTLNYLFNISIASRFHTDISILIFTIIFPILTLSSELKYISTKKSDFTFNPAFSVLIKNILSPLIFIYVVILYAYFAKITILQNLPKGDLSIIVCVFLSIGILVKSFLLGLKEHNILSKFLNKYFIYFMIIPIIFLDIAIYTRIDQYGLTIPRYLLILSSIWFTYLFLYELIKKEFKIKNALISLFLLSLFGSITPFNANDLSIKSQIFRLKNIFVENNMYINNKVIPAKQELKKSTRIDITLTLKYLIKRKEGIKALEKFLDEEVYNLSSALTYINVKYTTKGYSSRKYVKRFDINNIAINSKGYDYSSIIKFYSENKTVNFDNKSFTYYIKNSILNIRIENQLFQFDLKSIVEKLQKERIEYINNKNYKKAIFYLENKDMKIKLFIKSLFILGNNNNNLEIYSGDGMLFLKIK